MLLFPQKDEKATGTEQIFYVLSERESVIGKLGQMLRLAGFTHVEPISKSLKDIKALPLAAQARGIVIDVGNSLDPQEMILAIKTLVPRGIWCCVVGDKDAITLAQAYARHGLHYFYIDAEEDEFIQVVAAGNPIKKSRRAVNISVLGCKGGVGNTTIAYHLVNKIIQLRQMPTLFIQGKSGSHDLDLLFDKRMNQELMPVNKHLDLMCPQDGSLPQLKYETTEKYNFVIYEETANSADKEQLRQIIEHSSCLILTLDRSMSSIRVARQMIEINESINRAQRVPRRLLVCVSDSRPVSGDMLSVKDVQSLIDRKIDVVFPWQKSPLRASLFPLKQKVTPIDTLTQRVLGAPENTRSFKLRFRSGKAGEI